MRRVLALLLACGCAPDAPPDAGGRDAGPRDAGTGRDAGRDAGHRRRDAGMDGGTDAAGLDGGVDVAVDGGPYDPGWVRLPGLPDDCAIERALHPERLRLTWEPCSHGGAVIENCMVTRRPSNDVTVIGAWVDGGRVWLDLVGGNAARRIVGIAPLDGPVVAAWREPTFVDGDGDGVLCRVSAEAVGGGRAAFMAHLSRYEDDRVVGGGEWLYVGTPSTIGALTEPIYVFPSEWAVHVYTDDIWLSDQLLAMQTTVGTLYTFRDGEWDTLTGLGTVRGIPQGVAVVGDQVLWSAWRGIEDVRLVQARWGEASTVWRDISPADLMGFRTDGTDMAWFQNYEGQPDGSYLRSELWTAPYRRDLENVEAVRLRTVDIWSSRPVVGGGWLARSLRDPARIEVFSLRDGSRRTFLAPGNVVQDAPLYATANEIAFPGSSSTGGYAVVRFDPNLLPVDPE